MFVNVSGSSYKPLRRNQSESSVQFDPALQRTEISVHATAKSHL
jgi:hypothetical protein